MSGQKNIWITLGFALSVSLIVSIVSALGASYHCSRQSFELLNVVCKEVIEQEPEAKKIIAAALKEYTGGNPEGTEKEDVLASLGYHPSDFSESVYKQNILFAVIGFAAGVVLFFFSFFFLN